MTTSLEHGFKAQKENTKTNAQQNTREEKESLSVVPFSILPVFLEVPVII